MTSLGEKIDADVIAAYGSRTTPTHHFITQGKRETIVAQFATSLPAGHAFEDTTDLNYDVCVTLGIRRENRTADLLLSMVGPYATLVDTDGHHLNVTKIVSRDDNHWVRLFDLLQQAGLFILQANELTRPLRLSLPLRGADDCLVYNALFRDQAINRIR